MANDTKLIGEFLSELADDQDKLHTYLEQPEVAVEASGLHAEQREIVLSNDPVRIKEAINEEYAQAPLAKHHTGPQNIAPPQNITGPQNIAAPQNVIAPPPDDGDDDGGETAS
jgi:hypothetical protein